MLRADLDNFLEFEKLLAIWTKIRINSVCAICIYTFSLCFVCRLISVTQLYQWISHMSTISSNKVMRHAPWMRMWWMYCHVYHGSRVIIVITPHQGDNLSHRIKELSFVVARASSIQILKKKGPLVTTKLWDMPMRLSIQNQVDLHSGKLT